MSNLKDKLLNFADFTVNVVMAKVLIAVFAIGIFISVVWFFDLSTGAIVFTEKTIAYSIVKKENIRTFVKIEDVIKEKDKEDVYILSFSAFSNKVELPASVYEEYIGEGNNAITYESESVDLYVADKWFGFSFDTSKNFGVERNKLPWQDKDISFSDAEVEKFATTLLEKRNKLKGKDLPFEIDSFYTGHTNSNALENWSAIRWSDRTNKEK